MKKTIVNPVIKDEVTFVQTATETQGQHTMLTVKLMPKGGTPFHYHKNFSETFTVIQGELTLYLKGKKILLTTGQKYTVDKKKTHRFANDSDLPVFFSTTIQPGSAGFENSLSILYGLAIAGRTNQQGIPRNLLELAVITKMSDMHQPGLKALLNPVIHLCYLYARLKKIDRKLLEQFCGQSANVA